jgi:hypothetical protein
MKASCIKRNQKVYLKILRFAAFPLLAAVVETFLGSVRRKRGNADLDIRFTVKSGRTLA